MTAEELEKLPRTVVECWNRSDWTSYRTMTGPGFVYEEAGTGRRADDVEAVLAGWGRLKTAFPDAAAEIVQVQVECDVTIAGVIWGALGPGRCATAVSRSTRAVSRY